MKLDPQLLQTINSLTNDDDLRQELWVYHLSGNPQETLPSHLELISFRAREPERFRESIHNLMLNPPSTLLSEIIATFTPLEQSVICLLVIGYNISDIANHKGITEVRIRQLISVVRANPKWEELFKEVYGAQKTVK